MLSWPFQRATSRRADAHRVRPRRGEPASASRSTVSPYRAKRSRLTALATARTRNRPPSRPARPPRRFPSWRDRVAPARRGAQQTRRKRAAAHVVVDVPHEGRAARSGPSAERVHLQPLLGESLRGRDSGARGGASARNPRPKGATDAVRSASLARLTVWPALPPAPASPSRGERPRESHHLGPDAQRARPSPAAALPRGRSDAAGQRGRAARRLASRRAEHFRAAEFSSRLRRRSSFREREPD